MEQGVPRHRRARPVADAPINALLIGAEDLAKGWLLALLEQAPLDAAPEILAADLSRDGPRLCDAVVRALADDVDLRRIEPGGALEPLVARAAGFAGSSEPEAVSRAVGALHGIIWSALRAELRAPDADQMAELSERLTLVTDRVRAAALRREPIDVPEPGPPPPLSAPTPPPRRSGLSVAEPPSPEVEDEPLWMSAVRDEITGALRVGAPLSLLLAELEEAERILAIELEEESGVTFGRFSQAVRRAVRRKDILVAESGIRAWIVARDTSRAGAQALAARVAEAVREAEPWRGAPMVVSLGIAVLREDGFDVASLIDAAEEARFTASASGVSVVPRAETEEAPEPGNGPPPVAS
jgi:GGDEF domain-containing protein